MKKKPEVYQTTQYITPFMYVSKKENGENGRVILFVLLVSRTKDFDEIIKVAQKYMTIIQKEPFSESALICSDSLDYSCWVDSVAALFQKKTLTIIPKVLPEDFWNLDESFKHYFLEKIKESALSGMFGTSEEASSSLTLEASLTFEECVKGKILFENIETMEMIRMQKVYEPKK